MRSKKAPCWRGPGRGAGSVAGDIGRAWADQRTRHPPNTKISQNAKGSPNWWHTLTTSFQLEPLVVIDMAISVFWGLN